MIKKWLPISVLLPALFGCSAADALPPSVETEIEKAMGMDITIPQDERFAVTFVSLRFPPVVNGQEQKGMLVASIAYAAQKGKLIEISPEQKKQLELKGQQKILFGEYVGDQVIHCEISNMHNSLYNADIKTIEGVTVEYQFVERGQQKFLFTVFNWKQGAYSFMFKLSEKFADTDGFAFTQNVIKTLQE
jgi:hypothetical protein